MSSSKCPYCGSQLRDDSVSICPNCGNQIGYANAPHVSTFREIPSFGEASSAEIPIYTFDHRRRVLITAISLAAIFALLVLATIRYNLPLMGSDGSNDGMAYFLILDGLFAAISLGAYARSSRFEFYDQYVRIVKRRAAVEMIPYSELYLTPLSQGRSNIFRLMHYKDKVQVASWSFTNDKIKRNDGSKQRLLDAILPKMTSSLSSLTGPETFDQPQKIDAAKAKRFALFAIAGSTAILLGSYLLYRTLSFGNMLIQNGSPLVFPESNIAELYATAFTGFGCLIIACIYLRSACNGFSRNQRATIWRGVRTNRPTALLVLASITGLALALATTVISLLPLTYDPLGNLGLIALMASGFGFTVLILLTISYAANLVGVARAIESGDSMKKVLVLCAAMICVSLVTVLVASIAGIF